MKKLQALQRKKTKLVVGLMSGTSVDGIDAALVRISGQGTATRVKLLKFYTQPFPRRLRELVLRNSLPGTGTVDLICSLNVLFAHLYADAVKTLARKSRIPLRRIDLIGSHGQTVHHLPAPQTMFRHRFGSTLQIGDPSTIAKLTGIPTVGDFRLGDMALGGEGAPLVPYFDYLLFRSGTKSRILLNLGGIANFTSLPKRASLDRVLAFDTGPANMLIDGLMERLFHRRYDSNGALGMKGDPYPPLLQWLMRHPYLKKRPPKSTGREVFGEKFQLELLKKARAVSAQDIIATVTAFTPLSIYDQYRRFVSGRSLPDEILVSGGGVHNLAIMHRLSHLFAPARVIPMEEVAFSSDAKEAACFAVLANETIAENASNVPGVTGARHRAVLGKICL